MNDYFEQFLKNETTILGSLRLECSYLLASIGDTLNRLGCTGDMVEFGVYKGRSSIPVACFLSGSERFFAIDPFKCDPGNEKLKAGGIGDYKIFIENWDKIFGHTRNLKVYKSTSQSFYENEKRIIDKKKFKFVSIDGDHSFQGTLLDLEIAEKILTNCGIVAVDDCFNIEWPSVQQAVNHYLSTENSMAPFLAGWNKLFLCRTEMVSSWQAELQKYVSYFSENIENFWIKRSFDFHGKSILVVSNRWKPGYLPELPRDVHYFSLKIMRLNQNYPIISKIFKKVFNLIPG